MSKPPEIKAEKLYPIHQTAPGPGFGKLLPDKWTRNPVPEGKTFTTEYDGMKIQFRVDMNFYSDQKFIVVEVLNVKRN